jgi:hypothetical protein
MPTRRQDIAAPGYASFGFSYQLLARPFKSKQLLGSAS